MNAQQWEEQQTIRTTSLDAVIQRLKHFQSLQSGECEIVSVFQPWERSIVVMFKRSPAYAILDTEHRIMFFNLNDPPDKYHCYIV